MSYSKIHSTGFSTALTLLPYSNIEYLVADHDYYKAFVAFETHSMRPWLSPFSGNTGAGSVNDVGCWLG